MPGSRLRPALVVAAILAQPALAAGAVPSGNLVQNAGADAGPGSADAAAINAPPGWGTAGALTAVQYGANLFPTMAQSAAIGGGSNFFAGGPGSATSIGEQIFDVTTAAPEIDAGRVSARLSAHLGGYDTDDDAAKVTVEMQSAQAETTFATLQIGPVTPAERGNQTALLARTTTAAVPAGTRRIRLRLTATRADGAYNDGYADNISLVLSDGSPQPGATVTPSPSPTATASPSATPTVTVTATPTVTPPPASVPTRKKGSIKGLKSPGRRIKGRVTAKAPCKANRPVVVNKGAKTLGKKKTTATGRFNIKTKPHKKGKLTVKVRRRVVGTTPCPALTKRVSGRN